MDIDSFCLHAGAAALMDTAIGFEPQWRQHTVGLRPKALVAFGADLFAFLPHLLGGSPTAAHLAGQVMIGVGFLADGAIMKEDVKVKGMNTAKCRSALLAPGSRASIPTARACWQAFHHVSHCVLPVPCIRISPLEPLTSQPATVPTSPTD